MPDPGETESQLPPEVVLARAWNARLPPPELPTETSSTLAVEFDGYVNESLGLLTDSLGGSPVPTTKLTVTAIGAAVPACTIRLAL